MDSDEIVNLIKDNLRVEVRLSKDCPSTKFGEYIKCEVSLFFKDELISSENDLINIADE